MSLGYKKKKKKKLQPPNRYPKWYRKRASIISEALVSLSLSLSRSFSRAELLLFWQDKTHRSGFLAPLFFLLCIASALLRRCSSCAHSHLVSAAAAPSARGQLPRAAPRRAALTSRLMSSRRREERGSRRRRDGAEPSWPALNDGGREFHSLFSKAFKKSCHFLIFVIIKHLL